MLQYELNQLRFVGMVQLYDDGHELSDELDVLGMLSRSEEGDEKEMYTCTVISKTVAHRPYHPCSQIQMRSHCK